MQAILEKDQPRSSFPNLSRAAKRKLAVIDLDDTLLGPDKQISAANQGALIRLRQAGFETVIASGRHHENIRRYENVIGAMEWIISSGGAVVRHGERNEILHELTVPKNEALDVYAAAAAAGLSILVYHRDGVFCDKASEWTRFYSRAAGWTPEIADLSALAASGVQKVVLLHSAKRMESVRAEFVRSFGGKLYVVETQAEFLEFLSPHANKAFATKTLARKLAVDQSDVVAFGDGNNDIEMLSWSGFSVAMAHGRTEAHRAANRISPPGAPGTAFARAANLVLDL